MEFIKIKRGGSVEMMGDVSFNNSQPAFTQIELIFVIIIIAILAAVAIPNLAATRDDAKLSIDMNNMARCITEAGATYTASGQDIGSGDSKACDSVTCFSITYSSNGSDFIVVGNPGGANYCSDINELGDHLIGTYRFRGTGISI